MKLLALKQIDQGFNEDLLDYFKIIKYSIQTTLISSFVRYGVILF